MTGHLRLAGGTDTQEPEEGLIVTLLDALEGVRNVEKHLQRGKPNQMILQKAITDIESAIRRLHEQQVAREKA